MKLGLGTAQFGMDYGVSNVIGQTPADQVCAILRHAIEAGIRVIDTASAYGTAEQVIGESGLAGRFDIVTKTPPLSTLPARERADAVERAFLCSLERLDRTSVYGLLVHAAADLSDECGEEIGARIVSLREQGLVSRVGVSVYSADELDRASGILGPELVQLPLSVYDQRFLADGTIARLAGQGVEVHTRSALLQGVLAMSFDELPTYLASAREHHARYLEAIRRLGLSPVEAALGFALGVEGPRAVIVGVNTLNQLNDLLEVAPLDPEGFEGWAFTDLEILNPSRWGRA